MSLRRWTILLIAGTTLILIGMTLAITTRTLTGHYVTQEKIGVYLNVKRVLGAIDQQLTFLENTSNDWAAWDDTYTYVLGQNPGFDTENLQPSTFQGLGIDLMILVNTRAEVVFSGVSRPDQSLDATVPASLQSHLTPGDPLLTPPAGNGALRGLMLINNQPMLVIAHPILRNDNSGPPGGTLLIGRFLSSDLINSIGNILLLTISSTPVQAVQSDPQIAAVLAFRPTESEPNYVSLTPDQVSGYAILNDLFGQPMLIIRVDQYPTIYNNGVVVNNYLAISLVVSALAFSILLFFLIKFNVLNRIDHLSKEVIAIGASGDLHKRLSILHKDELSNLAATINRSLDALENAVSQHQESQELLRTRVQELGALYSISQQLLNQVEIAATEQTICTLAIENLGMQAAWIVTASPDGGVLSPAVWAGIERNALTTIPIYPQAGTPEHPAASAFTAMDIKIASLPEPGTEVGPLPESNTGTIVAVPLISVNKVLAVLVLKNAAAINPDSLALIRAFMNLSSVAIQNAFLFSQVMNGRERLQAVSRRLVEVQEEERRRIALELHDEIGQVLTSLRFSIDLIKSSTPEKFENQVDASTEIVNELIGRVRQISLDLRPSMLDDLGIVQTLVWFFDRYSRQTGIRVEFPPNNLGRQRFGPNLEITAYRVVQEALTNVARHAKVDTVTVRLWCNEKILGIQVEDKGVGFDVDAVFTSRNSKGLLGMWERIDHIGGHMDIVSESGEGTSLTVELPLEGILERRRLGR
jgi:signal transduction histidine kinase